MVPTPKPRRFLPILLLICAFFFIVREPAKAAVAATNAMHGIGTVADALITFASNLG
ncbi:hypothetical protein AB0O34_20160 [Sphaerisporangium sp. NPDC088356]|uniref:hypothetical protein n=1 Tax=Sphaerisporangium sp. NPDC088356 TaxID=3154871 RepID=UPI00342F69FA